MGLVVGRMAVRHNVAGIRDWNVTKQENGLKVRWVSFVVDFDEIFYAYYGRVSTDIVPNDGPSVAGEVLLQALQL